MSAGFKDGIIDSLLVASSTELTSLSKLGESVRSIAGTNKTGEEGEIDRCARGVLDGREGVYDTELVGATCRKHLSTQLLPKAQ